MSSILSTSDKEAIRAEASRLGACACGMTEAKRVEDNAVQQYRDWLDSGSNATMEYCAKYMEQRADPRLLLEGALTVISCAYAYSAPRQGGLIAAYASGVDYHYVLKQRLQQLGEWICARYGGTFRVCVDTAPIMEKYWAVKSGIGFIGCNSLLIVEGVGSNVFLGEILWTGELQEADEPCRQHCQMCGECYGSCPRGAIKPGHSIDASRCQSYLSIEHRGDLPDGTILRGYAYGCDLCQLHCPHNRVGYPIIPEFEPQLEIVAKSPKDWLALSSSQYKKLTARSAMRRVPYKQFMRNLKSLG